MESYFYILKKSYLTNGILVSPFSSNSNILSALSPSAENNTSRLAGAGKLDECGVIPWTTGEVKYISNIE